MAEKTVNGIEKPSGAWQPHDPPKHWREVIISNNIYSDMLTTTDLRFSHHSNQRQNHSRPQRWSSSFRLPKNDGKMKKNESSEEFRPARFRPEMVLPFYTARKLVGRPLSQIPSVRKPFSSTTASLPTSTTIILTLYPNWSSTELASVTLPKPQRCSSITCSLDNHMVSMIWSDRLPCLLMTS